MAAVSFLPQPSDEQSRTIGETIILQNMNLRKALHNQIAENDTLRQQIEVQRGILEDLAHAARAYCIATPMHDMPFAHALADALAYLKEAQS